jgi:hypothetical protein
VEDYIVRIYRRRAEDGGLFGVVEEVGIEGKKAFRSMAELVRLLQGDPHEAGSGSGAPHADTTSTISGGRP